MLFLPASGTTAGTGLGTNWVTTGAPTISHPAPASTNAGTQLKRTVYSQLAVTADQVLGPSSADMQFWKGNSSATAIPPTPPLGGYYFSCAFRIEAWAADTGRLFIGLASTGSGNVAAADAVLGDCCGLWHDTTDGADVLNYMHRNNTTTTKVNLGVSVANCSTSGASTTLSTSASFFTGPVPNGAFISGAGITAGTTVVSVTNATTLVMSAAMTVAAGTTLAFNPARLAAGQAFLWEMWTYPSQDSVINTNVRLTSINTATKLYWLVFGGGPRNTIFVAPQAQMSNGADIVAADFALGIANLYVANYPFPYNGHLLIQ